MEKKQYISPKTVVCQLQSEGIMYSTSVEIGEDWGDAKQNSFYFEEYSADDAAYPQAKSVWSADEKYDQW